MKNCKTFEKKLVAYIHGELTDRDFQAVGTHLETCESCRAELETLRATLNLLGEALEAASAPEELSAWRTLPHRVSAHRPTLSDHWYSPRFRAVLVTAAACSVFLLVSLSLVLPRLGGRSETVDAEQSFEAAPVARPKMPAKKIQVPVEVKKRKPKPRLRKRIVSQSRSTAKLAEVEELNIKMPEISGIKGGLGNMGGDGFDSLGFTMEVSLFGRAQQQASGSVVCLSEVERFNTEQYDRIVDNAFKLAMENPLSTFSIDVDRASYSNMRRFLNSNQLPPPDAVRIEELVNYFHYDYPQPRGADPFAVSMEVSQCPWNTEHQLALIGLQGLEIETADLPPNNLVFLLDVSGSMNSPDKLPLLKAAMRLLVGQLRPEDRVSIVVYAGAAGIVLEPTSDKGRILEAINRLNAGGSTAGGAGIELAYKTARTSFIKEGNNRVILATDGDFNVGVSSDGDLTRLIEEKRESGIFLSVLGFGTGNYKDSKMEKLADKGNGNYAYIDDILEAKKVLVTEMGGTLVAIAKDVKIQVEFNPSQVKAYRLVGYENRMLAKEDFADDTKDAGELGAGHTVTALYELIPATSDEAVPVAGALKYQVTGLVKSDDLMTVKLRYKKPDGDTSKLIVQSVEAADLQAVEVSENLRFASAVAEFGLLLRGSEYRGSASYRQILRRARQAKGRDAEGYRAEFIRLVEKAQLLAAPAE
ncbi:MAG: von Willebrand factor type A domain-containing protein [Verrucomicrobia bacterium]|nr:von Willebrand factor type A domain-containing protein [Verrucomicrobiota bacterium]